jgi:uncharacterized protein YbcV (DUF1398 family)
MTNGNVTVNGISDRDLVVVLEVKEKHEGKMVFNPQQLQTINNQPQCGKQTYNNVVLNWADHSGLKAVIEILQRLSTEEKH